MRYTPFVPEAAPLAGAVELVFTVDAYRPEHQVERLVPNGRTTLVFELDGRERYVYDEATRRPRQTCRQAWFSGTHTRSILIGDTSQESRLAAVQFAPGRAMPWVHASLQTSVDRVLPAVEVFGANVLDLRRDLLGKHEPQLLLEHLCAWLGDRYEAVYEPPPTVSEALREIVQRPSEIALTRFVEERGDLSYKHFVDLFKRHVGTTPKVLQRILRFAQVFTLLQERETVDWAELSLELGYADQSHFIRDFVAFSGYRPKRFLEDGHERLNFFPEDAGPENSTAR